MIKVDMEKIEITGVGLLVFAEFKFLIGAIYEKLYSKDKERFMRDINMAIDIAENVEKHENDDEEETKKEIEKLIDKLKDIL